MKWVRLTCLPRPDGSTDPHVFHSVIRGFAWPTRDKLLRATPAFLGSKGLFRLEDVEYEGYLGRAFITKEQAECLKEYLGFSSLSELANAKLIYSYVRSPLWQPRKKLGEQPEPTMSKAMPYLIQKKQWTDWALRYYKGEAEAPPEIPVRVSDNGDLYLFGMKISLYCAHGQWLLVRAEREGEWGYVRVLNLNHRPLKIRSGKILDKIIVFNGAVIDYRVVWVDKPKKSQVKI
jgi:hypothetical protein